MNCTGHQLFGSELVEIINRREKENENQIRNIGFIKLINKIIDERNQNKKGNKQEQEYIFPSRLPKANPQQGKHQYSYWNKDWNIDKKIHD
jgi:hypothetical protein